MNWDFCYIERSKWMPGNPPFKRLKYVNDELLQKARKKYFKWVHNFDEYRHMWN